MISKQYRSLHMIKDAPYTHIVKTEIDVRIISKEVGVDSLLECVALCLLTDDCRSISYREIDKFCQVNRAIENNPELEPGMAHYGRS